MVSSKHGARLSETDLQDLDKASQWLADAAGTIQRAKPAWEASVISLLVSANVVIVRLREKGAGAFARYLEKHGLQKPQDASESAAAAEISPSSPIVAPGEEEP